ncbi:hypothetical protein DID78_06050 [Candidatus Marinamargulisbacteria bacterium SCGC AG-343-D04]|nr:hypothetical protein DID78_06050 [Candidatus Marinamargulisbacteria bacterium SCGC AG-343-D04]
MEIRKFNRRADFSDFDDQSPLSEVASVLVNFKKKKVKVTKSKVKQMAMGIASIAHSLGETNDEENYAEEVAEDLFEALKLLK